MPSSTPGADPDRLDALLAGLRVSKVCVLRQSADHRYDLAENIPQGWMRQDAVGLMESDLFPAPVAAEVSQACDRVFAGSESETVEFSLGEGLTRRTFQLRIAGDGAGRAISVVTDVSDARAHETAVSALLREVSHRSKNLLAIVQSVAMQTAHHTGDIQDFLQKFRGRLHALSSTQDLVTESNWRGTYLHTLITAQLTRLGSSQLGHVRVTGENPLLGPNASLHIGLAIHELGANAALHGALADDRPGQVWVDARIVDQPGQDADLVIEWQEAGIDAGEAEQPRFGTLVLERIVPLSVGGSAEFYIEPDSVRYRLVVPADQFEV